MELARKPAQKHSVLFVITTQENMGDLALCQEWIRDLKREECRFAFAVSSNLPKFIDKTDTCFEFQPWIDVRGLSLWVS